MSVRGTHAPAFLEALPLAAVAYQFASMHHAGQQRDLDGSPFLVHPVEVASLLHHTGHPESLVAAGLLHDVVERTHVEIAGLAAEFGHEIAKVVAAVSEDAAIPGYAQRKWALRQSVAASGRNARAVFAADKVAKVRELRQRMRHVDGRTFARYRAHYRDSLTMLKAFTPEPALVSVLRLELELLDGLRPPEPALHADVSERQSRARSIR